MRLCCADGEKCDIHNAFPIRGCHAWTHLATCQREMDRERMRINGVVEVERGRKRVPSKLYHCKKKKGNAESGAMLERKEEHVLGRDCVKVWRAIEHTVLFSPSCDI